MSDTLRIKSTLPVGLAISEPHPDPEKPGNSPALKSAIIKPGLNEGVDADLFRAWSESGGKSFVATPDDVKAGKTSGKIYEMSEDEPEMEFGFEPALQRAVDADGDDAGKGSARTDPGPVPAGEMRAGSADAITAVPVLNSASPLKLPITDDGGSNKNAKTELDASKSGFAAVTPPAPAPAK